MPIIKLFEGSVVENTIKLPARLRNEWIEVYAIQKEKTPESIRETLIPLSNLRRKNLKDYCKQKGCTYDDAIETLMLKAELLDTLIAEKQHNKKLE